ncbi:MAG: hypothetical protein IH846_12920 [Acidobacteria bacterium]|nr:hypothetical protein [Acidobacteriota bacterium]
MRAWEHTYNTIRPHQALHYLTPQQFLTAGSQTAKVSLICWTSTPSWLIARTVVGWSSRWGA